MRMRAAYNLSNRRPGGPASLGHSSFNLETP